ncbi:MAG: efflux RND transporter permease subunit, partial [Planctomycetota bacterium]
MNVAEASIRYKVVSLVFTVMMIAGGAISYDKLSRLEDPEFTIKSAQVVTYYPGATAEEVAEEVTDEIETAIQAMGQLDLITSISQEGMSIILVDILPQYMKEDLPQVWDELRRKVNDMQGKLPPGTSTSVVNDSFGDVYGVFYAIYGDGYTYKELKDHADLLRRELLLVQDVGKINFYGDQPEAVYIEISRARIAQLGVSPELIYNTLSGQNLIYPSGKINAGSQYLRLQPSGAFATLEDIENLLIIQPDSAGSRLYLKDIATVRRDYREPPNTLMRFNGH